MRGQREGGGSGHPVYVFKPSTVKLILSYFFFLLGGALFYGVFCSIIIHKQISINNGGGGGTQTGREEERVSVEREWLQTQEVGGTELYFLLTLLWSLKYAADNCAINLDM